MPSRLVFLFPKGKLGKQKRESPKVNSGNFAKNQARDVHENRSYPFDRDPFSKITLLKPWIPLFFDFSLKKAHINSLNLRKINPNNPRLRLWAPWTLHALKIVLKFINSVNLSFCPSGVCWEIQLGNMQKLRKINISILEKTGLKRPHHLIEDLELSSKL
jgi:hypothetical protein